MGYGALDTHRNHHERAEGPRVRVMRIGDNACDRGARVTHEPRAVLGMLAPNSDADVGVVSDGELDGRWECLRAGCGRGSTGRGGGAGCQRRRRR